MIRVTEFDEDRYLVMVTENGVIKRTKPVSYTHLDVYKRQDLHCHPAAAGFRQAALGGRGDLVPFSERLVLLCSISEFPAALIAKSGSI